MARRVAVAIPAHNELTVLPACLTALGKAAAFAGVDALDVVVLANNCGDGTAQVAAGATFDGRLRLHVIEARLPPERAHAGWARRLALDAAAELLSSPRDLLLSTDADTLVAEDWLARTGAWFDRGWDAVAGLARLRPAELRILPIDHRARLANLRRYEQAITWLRAARDSSEPRPRHFYEGGASMALTHGLYQDIGGAPTPRVGEDKALFEAVRSAGGKVRHPMDVRVLTSPRLDGRAPGGASDTLAEWGRLDEDAAIPGVVTIAESLGLRRGEKPALTFRTLPAEIGRARDLVRLARQSLTLAAAG